MTRLLPALAALLLVGTVVAAALSDELRALRVDASTDSLILEDDPTGTLYARVGLLFTSDEFVLVGVTRDDLFEPAGIAAVESLTARFAEIDGIQDVLSITRVNLYRSHAQPVPPFQAAMQPLNLLRALGDQADTLDLDKARAELTDHELYAGNIISDDGRTAGIVVNLVATEASTTATRTWLQRLDARARARAALAEHTGPQPPPELVAAVAEAEAAVLEYKPVYTQAEDDRKAARIQIVREVREVVRAARAAGMTARASGVPAIVVEMVEAIEKDLYTFFGYSAAFVCLFLLLVFRRLRWMLIPITITLVTVIWTLLLMHLLGKKITVITANIPALLLVIGLAHSIHMIVRYRELLATHPDLAPAERARRMLRSLVWPCLFTMTTTAVGFTSLYFAGSRPIIDFGFLMAIGVGLAFAVSFVVFPAAVMVLPQSGSGRLERSAQALERLAGLSLRHPTAVGVLAVGLGVVGVAGIARIDVEARFIDYFDPSTDLFKGLRFIDDQMGGTSGLEIIVRGEAGAFGPANPDNVERVRALAAWLEDRDEIGTVMGYTGFLDELGKLFPDANLAMLTLALKRSVDDRTLQPYVVLHPTEAGGRVVEPYSTVRIVARAYETREGLQRNALLREVEAHLAKTFPPAAPDAPRPEAALRAQPTGMFVLYANMLASLVRSQVVTSVVALAAIFLMLTALFRSPTAALVALPPNALPIVLAIGSMGWAGVQLDMATVMIASVSLGIGIDAAIHYLFRFRDEFRKDGDLEAAIHRSHASIGTSILYTSLTTVVGFAVLYFSEFRPNAYFGVLTGLAMVAALFGMLTLLPVLLTLINPFQAEAPAGDAPTADAHPPAAQPPAAPAGDPQPPATPGGDAQPPTTPGGDAQPPTTRGGDAQPPADAAATPDAEPPAASDGDRIEP